MFGHHHSHSHSQIRLPVVFRLVAMLLPLAVAAGPVHVQWCSLIGECCCEATPLPQVKPAGSCCPHQAPVPEAPVSQAPHQLQDHPDCCISLDLDPPPYPPASDTSVRCPSLPSVSAWNVGIWEGGGIEWSTVPRTLSATGPPHPSAPCRPGPATLCNVLRL